MALMSSGTAVPLKDIIKSAVLVIVSENTQFYFGEGREAWRIRRVKSAGGACADIIKCFLDRRAEPEGEEGTILLNGTSENVGIGSRGDYRTHRTGETNGRGKHRSQRVRKGFRHFLQPKNRIKTIIAFWLQDVPVREKWRRRSHLSIEC